MNCAPYAHEQCAPFQGRQSPPPTVPGTMTKRLPNAAQAAAAKAECARKLGRRVEAKQGSADALRSLRRIRRRVDRKLNWRRTPGETDVIPTLFRMR